MTRQEIVSSYLRQVRRNCPFSFRRKLITDLESHILDYLDDNPGSTLEDVINYLGPPEKIADECLLAMDEIARQRILDKTKWIKRAILIGISIIVLITACTAFYTLIKISETRVYYIQESITNEDASISQFLPMLNQSQSAVLSQHQNYTSILYNFPYTVNSISTH